MEPPEEPAMTEAAIARTETPDASSPGMLVVRYGLGAVMILGGIVLQVGNMVLDASIRNRLEKLRKSVAQAA